MPESPPTLPTPPVRTPTISETGHATPPFAQWLELLHKRVGGSNGAPIIGDVAVFQTTVGQADLASAGTVTLLDVQTGEQWKIREIVLSGAGTNFSGGGGDRLLSVSDGTSTWTVIPAATLQTLSPARWGDAGAPYPATAAHLTTAAVADVVAAYSGGASDYSAGSLTLIITAERVA